MPFHTVEYTALSDNELAALSEPNGKLNYFNCIVCPFAHRALWAALEINAPIDTVIELDVFNLPPSYKQNFNRYGNVPFLIHNGFNIYDSQIIVNYLDSEYGHGKLARVGNSQEASISALASAKVSHIPFYRFLMGRDENDAPLRDHLTELETIYRDHASAYRSSGPFLLGSEPSTADFNIVPLLFRFEILLDHYNSYNLLADFPHLAAALESSKTRPAFKESSREPAFYIQGYASVAAEAKKEKN